MGCSRRNESVPAWACGVAVIAAAAMAGLVAPSGVASSGFVRAKVAGGQTVLDLRNQGFVQTVTCSRGCDVTTVVSIALSDARRLGFKGAATPWVRVASSYVRLKSNTPTKVGFVLSRQGRILLPRAKSGLRVVGRLIAIATANRRLHSLAGWSTVLE
jgi:hypothetical protein